MDLLLCLVQNNERCVPKDELRETLWPRIAVGEASLVRLVKELRKALGEGGAQFLRTVHGRGYQLVGCRSPERKEQRGSGVFRVDAASSSELGTMAPALGRVVAPLERVAKVGLPVILEGEPGTGKDYVARAIHAWSGRSGAIVPLRCHGASEPELAAALSLAEAPDSTLLIDGLGELPIQLQGRLLSRFSCEDISAKSSLVRRTVTTSQRSLASFVESGALRGDLLGRLSGFRVELPPLRKRREDIVALVEIFLGDTSVPPPSGRKLEALVGYGWPLNVYELEMCVLHAIALAGDDDPWAAVRSARKSAGGS